MLFLRFVKMKIRQRRTLTFWCRSILVALIVVLLVVNFAFRKHVLRYIAETYPDHNTYDVTISEDTRPPMHRITVDFQGRLGNQLFMFASLLGIAETNNLIPVIIRYAEMLGIFKHSVPTFTGRFKHAYKYAEKRGCVFEENATKIGSDKDVILNGYFQSWKYFLHIEDDIRHQLMFRDDIFNKAKQIFTDLTRNMSVVDPVYIGVHVRRGDFMSKKKFVDYGYVAADEVYLRQAFKYTRDKYKNVVFVVASDDLRWCKEHLADKDVTFVDKGNKPAVDMATLTFCNHSIMTTGSFGWWASYLTGGDTVYYGKYPKPNSELDKRFNKTTYYPPQWIAL